MIGAIAPYITRIRRSYQSNDIIDRLNYQYTAMLLAFSALTLAATQYLGKPIQCWVPPEFTGAWERYAESYCFVKGSYFLPLDAEIDDSYNRREEVLVGYYQWVPLVLAAQTMLFYAPSFIWKALNFNTGINVKSVLNSAGKRVLYLLATQYHREAIPHTFLAMVKKKFDRGTRSEQVAKAANHLTEALEIQKELKTSTFLFGQFGKRRGIYLTGLYLFTKLLYVANIVLQFVILNTFLGPSYTLWGIGILKDLWNGHEWTESGHFPRVTMCDFNVRILGNIHRWTIQCVLMINMFNEKVFIFFWFWFIFVGILSVLSFLYWLLATALYVQRRAYICKYLRCTGAITDFPTTRDQRLIRSFVRDFLRPDGVFLLRLIQTNGGDLLVGEIINTLFRRHQTKAEIAEAAIDSGESKNNSKLATPLTSPPE